MEKLEIVQFENQAIQIYRSDNEILMTIEELAAAIGYTSRNIKIMLETHTELGEEEFSILRKVNNLEGGVLKKREKRFFTEQGIYEVAFLANTDKGKKFRKFARALITNYHRNNLQIVNNGNYGLQIQDFNNKLDTINQILVDRQEVFESIDKSSEKEVELLEKMQSKLEQMDQMNERINKIEIKIGEMIVGFNSMVENINSLYDILEEKKNE